MRTISGLLRPVWTILGSQPVQGPPCTPNMAIGSYSLSIPQNDVVQELIRFMRLGNMYIYIYILNLIPRSRGCSWDSWHCPAWTPSSCQPAPASFVRSRWSQSPAQLCRSHSHSFITTISIFIVIASCFTSIKTSYHHMSVRQYSLYNPVPWTNGGFLSVLRVLAQLKTKVSLLGVSATI